MLRIYGDHTCVRCGKAPIVTIPKRDALPEECRWEYYPQESPRSAPELWNVFYPSEPHPERLCNYCLRVKEGKFSIVPIVDIVRKIGSGRSLTKEERARYMKHLNIQAKDKVWHR